MRWGRREVGAGREREREGDKVDTKTERETKDL